MLTLPQGAFVAQLPAANTPVCNATTSTEVPATNLEVLPSVKKSRYKTAVDADGFTTKICMRPLSNHSGGSATGLDTNTPPAPVPDSAVSAFTLIPSQPIKNRRLSKHIAANSKHAASTCPPLCNSFSVLKVDTLPDAPVDEPTKPAAPAIRQRAAPDQSSQKEERQGCTRPCCLQAERKLRRLC
jgi:hypothetical protein